MKTVCIIPVNKLDNIKSRLSNFFSIEQRIELNIKMLNDVLLAIKYSKNIDETYIVTPDNNVINIIKKFKCRYLLEKKKLGVNIAVQKAISKSIIEGATAAIILPSDIPLISSDEIDRIINHGKTNFTVTHGMRVAQMVIKNFVQAALEEIKNLKSTKRGSGGFGSTGTK